MVPQTKRRYSFSFLKFLIIGLVPVDYIKIPVTRQQIAGFSSRYDSLTFARWPVYIRAIKKEEIALDTPSVYANNRLQREGALGFRV